MIEGNKKKNCGLPGSNGRPFALQANATPSYKTSLARFERYGGPGYLTWAKAATLQNIHILKNIYWYKRATRPLLAATILHLDIYLSSTFQWRTVMPCATGTLSYYCCSYVQQVFRCRDNHFSWAAFHAFSLTAQEILFGKLQRYFSPPSILVPLLQIFAQICSVYNVMAKYQSLWRDWG